jgi:hypothetical protein
MKAAGDRLLELIRSRNPRLVFLGEDHRHAEVKAIYADVIGEIARNPASQVCYFHELSEAMNGALQGLGAMNRSTLVSTACFELAYHEHSRNFRRIFDRQPSHWLNPDSLANLARRGVRLTAVDWSPTETQLTELRETIDQMSSPDSIISDRAKANFDRILITERNPIMGARIRSRFASEGCTIAFISVGLRHLFPRAGIVPLQQDLSSLSGHIVVNGRNCPPMGCNNESQADLNLFLW